MKRIIASHHLIAAALFLPLFMAGIASATAAATEPAELRLSQSWQDGTELTSYLDVRDAHGEPVGDLDPERLHVTIGPHAGAIESVEPFAATEEGVLYLFLVDRSRSLSAARFAQIRAALMAWVAALQPNDLAGIITFGERVETVLAPTADRSALDEAIGRLAPTDQQTALHQGLVRAITLGQQQRADWPRRRAIVILSDGLEDAPGGMTADEVHARLAENPAPIYAIGLSTGGSAERRTAGLAALGRFARESGGLFLDANRAEDLSAPYAEMRDHIRAVWRLRLQCPDCTLDGNRYRLQITLLSDDGLRLTDGSDLRLLPPPVSTEEPEDAEEDIADSSGTESEPEAADTADAGETASEEAAETGITGILHSNERWVLAAGGIALVVLLIILAVVLRARGRQLAQTTAATMTDQAELAIPATASDKAGEPSLSLDADALVTERGQMPAAPSVPPADHATPQAPPVNILPQLRLAFVTGPRRGEVVELSVMQPARLGRSADCALVLSGDDEISGRHAEVLCLDNGQRVLRDLSSTNGTRLNGVGVQGTHPLQNGDRIGVGQTELRVLS
ncbi:FHA domain-containing protein [Thiorhodovibrio frisius]|uniref:FHA domain-containing protein n=1 Tax=Thiorhodovibrio frisius TaxID=631362 RepID=H8YZZ6_9GAMM|nr:FHA domain-containing protein [Thiorhodovibrio frisius]EIC21169.1 FHA domain-containing protein [Thiorhodovibrio frisius]WPL23745.1 VWFA-related Acidobacterial domain protein [Thiorhodovibrio frisius]